MSICIENEYEFDFDVQQLCENLLNAIMKKFGYFSDIDLNIVITSDDEIKDINKKFRKIDKATDVLSFPSIEFGRPGDFNSIDLDNCSYFNQDNDALILGDMMISYERVISQAKEYGHSIKREFAFLVVHSILHLLGYDHENKEDEKIMRKRQTEILNSLGIIR